MHGLFKVIQNYVNNKINNFFTFLIMCFYRLRMSSKLTYFLYHDSILFSEKELCKANTNVLSKSFNSAIYSWDILQLNFKKSLVLKNLGDCLTGLGLNLWYIGLGLKTYLNYLTGLGLILWYTRGSLETYLDYLGFGLILWHTGLGIEKHLD